VSRAGRRPPRPVIDRYPARITTLHTSPAPSGEDLLAAAPPAPQRWWRELMIVAVFYGLYTLVRDLNGPGNETAALSHARLIIGWERHLGVFDEAAFQRLVVHDRSFMRFWDGYYGTVHFLAVIGVLLYLYNRRPEHYRLWRNALAVMTGVGLLCFFFFPLLPPRLLPSSYGFDDTLATIGGVWDFRSGAVNAVSDQFAAMPSLHTGWSLWCALALWSCVGRRRLRPLLLVYPAATIFCIVVTANHYFADAVGGLLSLGIGYAGARLLTAVGDRWRLRRAAREALLGSVDPVPSS
jgi:hypothetical protein